MADIGGCRQECWLAHSLAELHDRKLSSCSDGAWTAAVSEQLLSGGNDDGCRDRPRLACRVPIVPASCAREAYADAADLVCLRLTGHNDACPHLSDVCNPRLVGFQPYHVPVPGGGCNAIRYLAVEKLHRRHSAGTGGGCWDRRCWDFPHADFRCPAAYHPGPLGDSGL